MPSQVPSAKRTKRKVTFNLDNTRHAAGPTWREVVRWLTLAMTYTIQSYIMPFWSSAVKPFLWSLLCRICFYSILWSLELLSFIFFVLRNIHRATVVLRACRKVFLDIRIQVFLHEGCLILLFHEITASHHARTPIRTYCVKLILFLYGCFVFNCAIDLSIRLAGIVVGHDCANRLFGHSPPSAAAMAAWAKKPPKTEADRAPVPPPYRRHVETVQPPSWQDFCLVDAEIAREIACWADKCNPEGTRDEITEPPSPVQSVKMESLRSASARLKAALFTKRSLPGMTRSDSFEYALRVKDFETIDLDMATMPTLDYADRPTKSLPPTLKQRSSFTTNPTPKDAKDIQAKPWSRLLSRVGGSNRQRSKSESGKLGRLFRN